MEYPGRVYVQCAPIELKYERKICSNWNIIEFTSLFIIYTIVLKMTDACMVQLQPRLQHVKRFKNYSCDCGIIFLADIIALSAPNFSYGQNMGTMKLDCFWNLFLIDVK